MIAIITGDIIASRKLVSQDKWLLPLKELLATWGNSPQDWKIERGDFFQIEITNVEEALKKALEIKALIKKIEPTDKRKKISGIEVRIAIGIGEKNYSGESVSESNGTAFINSSTKFELLRKENLTLGVKTAWKDIDEEINLYLRLVTIFMDKWTISSAELIQIALNNPTITQEEIGKKLGIKQSGVSRRWNRANASELLEVEKTFRKKIKALIR